ncbi:MAG: glycosyltransferase family 4 protein [Phototrophicales bacterium]|nr:glycosyltransferase family 4 protein [Phototrophicales bacterium]
MTRFLILSLYDYADVHGGGQKLAYDQATYLTQQGHEVWLLTQDPTHQHPPHRIRAGVHLLTYPSPNLRLFDPRRGKIHQNNARNLVQAHMPNPPDVVHGHALLTYDGLLGIFPNARYAYTVHSPVKLELQASARGLSTTQRLKLILASHITHRIEKQVLAHSHIITSDSAYTKQILGDLHGSSIGDKVRVMAGWVDKTHFFITDDRETLKQQFGVSPGVPFFFTLRRLEPRNGIDMLLHALKIVHEAGHPFQMVIGGGGSQKESLIALRDTLGLTNHIRFLGRVDDADLPRWYSACDVFLLPTHTLECFGIITLESFASGRPVIATPVGAIPEIVNQIEPRWLSSDNTATAFAQTLIAYLHGELPHHPPQKLRDFALNHYEQQTRLSAFEELLLS